MNAAVDQALRSERTIDITTTGRRSGRPSRVEIWFHNVDDTIYITGSPGTRDWYANLLENPRFVFHLKQSINADLPAIARPILESHERQAVLTEVTQRVGARNLDAWMSGAPLVAIEFDAESDVPTG